MVLIYTFYISGLFLALLIGTKVWEEHRKNRLFILSWISKGDERVRNLSHRSADTYAEWKEKGKFFIEKELPLHIKSFMLKTNSLIKEKYEAFMVEIRGERFLKRSEGVSEFLKSISEMEEGRIDDSLSDPDVAPTSESYPNEEK